MIYPPNILDAICEEHGKSTHQMAETLLLAGVPLADVELLRLLPLRYLANRIAVERKRLDVPVEHSLFSPLPTSYGGGKTDNTPRAAAHGSRSDQTAGPRTWPTALHRERAWLCPHEESTAS